MSYLIASEARKTLYTLIDQVAANHEPALIKGKRNTAVLLSVEDWENIQETCLRLLELLEQNPWQITPPYKKLQGIYKGMYSRRINLQHRLFYEIDEDQKRIKILRM